jgi:hypothetical protein
MGGQRFEQASQWRNTHPMNLGGNAIFDDHGRLAAQSDLGREARFAGTVGQMKGHGGFGGVFKAMCAKVKQGSHKTFLLLGILFQYNSF